MRSRGPYRRPTRVAAAGVIISAAPELPREKRVLLKLDTGDEWSVERKAWAESGLTVDQSVTADQIQQLFDAEDLVAASNSAARLLGVRNRSTAELRQALNLRGYPDHIIARVIDQFTERRYLDDQEFARRWIAIRTEMAPRSNRLLGRELRAKGVDTEVIDESIEEAALDDTEMAMDLARRRLERMSGEPWEVRRRRIIDFLQRRGFGWDAIGAVDRALLRGHDESESVDDFT
jgi:regulatory protein